MTSRFVSIIFLYTTIKELKLGYSPASIISGQAVADNLQKLINENRLWFAENNATENESLRLQNIFAGTTLTPTTYTQPVSNSIVPFKISDIDHSLPEGGLPFGAVHEFVVSHSRTGLEQSANMLGSILIANCIEALLDTCAEKVFSKLILWISISSFPVPYILFNNLAALENKFSLEDNLLNHCIFLKACSTKNLLQTIDLALGSPAVSMLIAEVPTIPFSQERRFSVRAREHNIFTLFFRAEATLKRNSPAHSRWQLSPLVSNNEFPCFMLTLESKKGCQPARRSWQITFNDSGDLFTFATYVAIDSASIESTRQDIVSLVG